MMGLVWLNQFCVIKTTSSKQCNRVNKYGSISIHAVGYFGTHMEIINGCIVMWGRKIKKAKGERMTERKPRGKQIMIQGHPPTASTASSPPRQQSQMYHVCMQSGIRFVIVWLVGLLESELEYHRFYVGTFVYIFPSKLQGMGSCILHSREPTTNCTF